jgi:hypothetical protein
MGGAVRTNLKLLRQSLKKYDRTFNFLNEHIGEPIREDGGEFYVGSYKTPYGGEDCPFCCVYNNDDTPMDDVCVGCYIAESTGRVGCCGTPYWNYEDALFAANTVNKALVDAIREERDFLKNLYEKLKKER